MLYRKHELEMKRAYEQWIIEVEHASFTPIVLSACTVLSVEVSLKKPQFWDVPSPSVCYVLQYNVYMQCTFVEGKDSKINTQDSKSNTPFVHDVVAAESNLRPCWETLYLLYFSHLPCSRSPSLHGIVTLIIHQHHKMHTKKLRSLSWLASYTQPLLEALYLQPRGALFVFMGRDLSFFAGSILWAYSGVILHVNQVSYLLHSRPLQGSY